MEQLEKPTGDREASPKAIPADVRDAESRIDRGVRCETCGDQRATALLRRADSYQLVCADCRRRHEHNALFASERARRQAARTRP
jgi:hypothetical protein